MAAGDVPAHSEPASATDARPPVELRRGVVGFGGVLFQSITFMAPAIATAFPSRLEWPSVGERRSSRSSSP